MLHKLKPYLQTMRLSHQNPVLVALFAGALDSSYLNLTTLLILAVPIAAISIGIFIVNEYVDAKDTDVFQLRSKTLTKHNLNRKILTLIWLTLTVPSAIILLYYGLIWQALAMVIVGTFYSLPPLRFKANFPWDLISQAVVFFIAPYSIAFQLSGRSLYELFTVPFFSLMLFLTTAQLIHLIIDHSSDKAAGLQNTAVVIGPMNLLRLAKAFLIIATLGFAYLIFKNTHYWYYPIILVAPYVGWSLGRLRETVFRSNYNPKPIDNPLLTTYDRAIRMGNFLIIYFLGIIIYLTSR